MNDQRANSAFFKYTIKENLMDALYEAPQRDLISDIYDITTENLVKMCVRVHPTVNYYFYFQGKKYYNTPYNAEDIESPWIYREQVQIDLHPDLRDRMHQTAIAFDDIETEKGIIGAFINKVLNTIESIADIYALLPKAIHPLIKYTAPNSVVTLTTTEQEMYIKKWQHLLSVLNQRVLTNLIIKE